MKIEAGDINLKSTLLSGQCFRVIEEENNSFTIILFDRVINVIQAGEYIIVKSNNMDNIESIIVNYFDLNTNYNKINKLLKVDTIMDNCIDRCKGYKILRQNPFEMCISYIISQNNNVKRISNSINRLCELKGEKIKFNDIEYHLFPSYGELKDVTIDELRSTGVGFRDRYIINFLNNYSDLAKIENNSTIDATNKLMNIKGIGLKVASCILLFGYHRFDTFPIDTWVKKFISNNYNIKNDQKTIEIFAKNKFGSLSGLAVQYMYHSERNIK